ncbi:hypothetical protein D3C84_914350 [compost metagenome]
MVERQGDGATHLVVDGFVISRVNFVETIFDPFPRGSLSKQPDPRVVKPPATQKQRVRNLVDPPFHTPQIDEPSVSRVGRVLAFSNQIGL